MTDREKALAYFRHREAQIPMPGARAMYQEAIKALEQPTIEPERKKGKWVHGREMAREMIRDCTTAIFYEGWTCSECGCLVEKEREPWYKYCPNCGSYNGGDKDDQR